MKAIVIGAGVGGLSAAIALRKAGVETVVFERARELKEIGAGLSLMSNATKALNGLGLTPDALRGIGVPIGVAEIRTWRGEVLSRIPAWQLSEKLGAQSVAVHRADLQGALLRELGDEAVRLDAACVSFEQDSGGVRAFFADGTQERAGLSSKLSPLATDCYPALGPDDGARREEESTSGRVGECPGEGLPVDVIETDQE
jgi:2-polyprenyl-6-methoxyphenol hydroxylase-like FAD-dependent oxidoreductase